MELTNAAAFVSLAFGLPRKGLKRKSFFCGAKRPQIKIGAESPVLSPAYAGDRHAPAELVLNIFSSDDNFKDTVYTGIK